MSVLCYLFSFEKQLLLFNTSHFEFFKKLMDFYFWIRKNILSILKFCHLLGRNPKAFLFQESLYNQNMITFSEAEKFFYQHLNKLNRSFNQSFITLKIMHSLTQKTTKQRRKICALQKNFFYKRTTQKNVFQNK